MPANLWNADEASGLAGLSLLAYRSRLLAADRSIVNVFGGNTSSKVMESDHLGRQTLVLWVKGSGSDMAECSEASFAGLRMAEVMALRERDELCDEDMVEFLARCAFEPGRPRQSIETLLHAFIPFDEVDHTHPDSVIALGSTRRGRDAAAEVFGRGMVWVDYVRPGFSLSQRIAEGVAANPAPECVVMGKHGLVTWGADAEACYAATLAGVQKAEDAVREAGRKVWTGSGEALPEADPERYLPELRGALSAERRQVLRIDRSPRVLQMANTPESGRLSQAGVACPDHLVHLKRKPLFLALDFETDAKPQVDAAVEAYRREYEGYFTRHACEGQRMFDSAPRVTLIPGSGLVAAGRDAGQAEVSRELYHRAVEVIEGAEAVGGLESLTEAEAFEIEYWPLELYKLSLRPPERQLAGHIALVTGGGSGIGRAAALRMAEEGAHVCVADLNGDAAGDVASKVGGGRSIACPCDVADEEQVREAVRRCVLEWGGLDVVVCSAGIASSAPVEETTVADWERNFAVLAKGYFLPSREAFRVWRRQGIGGSLVFVTSKNAVAAGKNASAYSAAKAAEQHLARCLAEEGGPIGVRVNSVLPDAVLQGSSIWSGEWREQRAAAYGVKPEELEEFYRQRTTLKLNVTPDDVAEAILFLAGPRSSKTTGAALTVDAGVPGVYLR